MGQPKWHRKDGVDFYKPIQDSFDEWLETVEITVDQGTTPNAICVIPALREAFKAGQRTLPEEVTAVIEAARKHYKYWQSEGKTCGCFICTSVKALDNKEVE